MGDGLSRDRSKQLFDPIVPGGVLGAKPNTSLDPSVWKIILIGPDCSGKSNIARHIAHKLGVLPVGNRRINDDLQAAIHVLNFVNMEVRRNDAPFVLDQFMYPVDIVYNNTLRHSASIMDRVEPMILKHLVAHNVLFLHIDANPDTLEERFNQRGDELWDINQIIRVSRAYRHYFAKMQYILHYRYLDTSDLDKKASADAALKLVENFYSWEMEK